MKRKLLSSALLLGAIAINAQTVSVTVDGTPVENGATATSTNFTEFDDPGYYTIMFKPEVLVSVDKAATVEIKITNTSEVNQEFLEECMNTVNSNPYIVNFCWAGGCVDVQPGAQTSKSEFLEANSPSNLEIDSFVNMKPCEGFNQRCKIDAIIEGSEVFSFNLIISPGETNGVDLIETQDEAPVYYNLNGVRVNNPDKGIFIIKKGNKITKTIL